MDLAIYQIDAFTDKIFGGNPACVIPLQNWLNDKVLLKIAAENGVAETAFFIDNGDRIQLRWFTPENEIDLCGHATLATAHVLKNILNHPGNIFIFETSSGLLTVTIENEHITLNFPSRKPIPSTLPEKIKHAINMQPSSVLKVSQNYLLVYETELQVKGFQIDKNKLDTQANIIITAKGNNYDFVSRFFSPPSSIFEDPVTGAAHCVLTPFWSEILNKKKLHAMQLSERMGQLFCVDKGDRVLISGQAVAFATGKIHI